MQWRGLGVFGARHRCRRAEHDVAQREGTGKGTNWSDMAAATDEGGPDFLEVNIRTICDDPKQNPFTMRSAAFTSHSNSTNEVASEV